MLKLGLSGAPRATETAKEVQFALAYGVYCEIVDLTNTLTLGQFQERCGEVFRRHVEMFMEMKASMEMRRASYGESLEQKNASSEHRDQDQDQSQQLSDLQCRYMWISQLTSDTTPELTKERLLSSTSTGKREITGLTVWRWIRETRQRCARLAQMVEPTIKELGARWNALELFNMLFPHLKVTSNWITFLVFGPLSGAEELPERSEHFDHLTEGPEILKQRSRPGFICTSGTSGAAMSSSSSLPPQGAGVIGNLLFDSTRNAVVNPSASTSPLRCPASTATSTEQQLSSPPASTSATALAPPPPAPLSPFEGNEMRDRYPLFSVENRDTRDIRDTLDVSPSTTDTTLTPNPSVYIPPHIQHALAQIMMDAPALAPSLAPVLDSAKRGTVHMSQMASTPFHMQQQHHHHHHHPQHQTAPTLSHSLPTSPPTTANCDMSDRSEGQSSALNESPPHPNTHPSNNATGSLSVYPIRAGSPMSLSPSLSPDTSTMSAGTAATASPPSQNVSLLAAPKRKLDSQSMHSVEKKLKPKTARRKKASDTLPEISLKRIAREVQQETQNMQQMMADVASSLGKDAIQQCKANYTQYCKLLSAKRLQEALETELSVLDSNLSAPAPESLLA